jgi:hypothetical protein
VAINTTRAAPAGLVAPMMVGALKTLTGGFTASLYVLSGALVLSALLMLLALPASALAKR